MGGAAARVRGLAKRAARPAIGVAVVAVLGADVFVLTQRNVSTAVTLGESVERYRASPRTTDPAPAAPVVTITSMTTSIATRPRLAGSAPTLRRGSSATAATARVPPAAPRPFTAPAAGVYSYATTGFEKVSLAGARHDYPKESFATVRHGDGCHWDSEHRVVEEHVETARYCALPGVVGFFGTKNRETFFGHTETVTVVCDPAQTIVRVGDLPGTRRTFRCSLSDGSRLDETVTYLGRATLTIGGTPVDVFHVLVAGRESGNVQGTSRLEVWLHPLTGLPLRQVVHVQTRSHSFGADVDYTEDASYTLEHLDPST